jgi:hypothetical protein
MERTGIEPATPLLAKPNEKVPRFYKLLNLRAVRGIGVEVEGPFGGAPQVSNPGHSRHGNSSLPA